MPRNPHQLMENIIGACDVAMSKIKPTLIYYKPQFWWTDEVAELRRASLSARRQYQKAAKRDYAEEQNRIFKEAKKSLRLAIRRSQENCWKNLCAEVDHNPWGIPYRAVMREIG